MKVTNGRASNNKEVSQETLNRSQREDTSRRAQAMDDDRTGKQPENNGAKVRSGTRAPD
jgi:hypothetical protein